MAEPTAPMPYIHFPGTARQALDFYGEVFGCAVELHTFAEFNRTDGPPEAIAHGYLRDGPVRLFAADVTGDQPAVQCQGLMFSLLGTASPSTLRTWFSRLAEGGRIVDDLQERPWGAWDGHVIDRNGLHWLIGFEEPGDQQCQEASGASSASGGPFPSDADLPRRRHVRTDRAAVLRRRRRSVGARRSHGTARPILTR